MQRRLDLGVIAAIAWLITAIGVTLLVGPQLGARGWLWLGVHHVLCVAGVTHELVRGWRRRQAALSR